MKRNGIKIWLQAILLMATGTNTSASASEITIDNLAYTYEVVSNGTAVSITDIVLDGRASLVIPGTINGLPVISIGEDCAYDDSHIDDLKTITIPASVIFIGDDAFDDDILSTNSLQTVIFQGADGAGALEITDKASFGYAATISLDRNISSSSGTEGSGDCLFHHATSVTIGPHVSNIKDKCFKKAPISNLNLTGATALKTIGKNAFYDCDGLASLILPASVTTLGEEAFCNCDGLKTVDLSACTGLTVLPRYVFGECTGISTLSLPPYLLTVGDYAFWRNSIHEIRIPGTVTYIGDNAFDVQGSSNDILSVIFEPAPEGYVNKPLKIVDTANFKAATDIHIARDIDSASGSAGDGNGLFDAAVNVYIEAGCTDISAKCFIENDNLLKLDFEKAATLTSISAKAFYGCDGLTSLVFPASLTTIGSNAFYSCDGLLDVNMGYCTAMKSIEDETFNGCTSINHLVLPSYVETIGKKAFYRNSLAELTVPATCNLIDEDAFDVEGINSITLLSLLGSDTAGELTIIDDDNFQSVTSLNLDRHLSSECTAPVFGSIEGASIGSHVKRISTVPFKGSKIEKLYLNLATSLTTIDADAFYECYWLEDFNLANTRLATIGEKAFYNCNGITSLTFPATLETIGKSSFFNCERLEKVDFSECTLLTVIPEEAFRADNALTTLLLPPYVQTLGKASFYGNDVSEIIIPASCTLIDEDALDDVVYNSITKATLLGDAGAGKLTLNDAATFTNVETLILDRDLATPDEVVLFPDVVSLAVGGNVHAINPYCFSGCNNLESVDFSNAKALTTIGKSAFYGCTDNDFESVDLSSCTALTSIGENAFNSCNALASVKFPASLQNIGKAAFYDAHIETVTIPASVSFIGEDAFDYAPLHYDFDFYRGVKSVTFLGSNDAATLLNADVDCFKNATYVYLDRDIDTPEGSFGDVESLILGSHMKSIPQKLFAESNVKVVDATGATALTSIGDSSFYSCGDLTNADFSKCRSLVTLGEKVFSDCDDLLACSLPGCLKTVGASAFAGCTSMTACNLPSGITSIGESAFLNCDRLAMNYEWPAGVAVVPKAIFSNCTSLTGVVLPEGVTEIQNSAFFNSGLSGLVIPSTVNSIGSYALNLDNESFSIEFKGNDDAEELVINGTVGCTATSVTIDRDIKVDVSSLYSNSEGFFAKATKLVIGEHTGIIDDNLFAEGKLTSLDLTAATSLKSIGKKAFYNCTGLKSVDLSASTRLTSIKESTFDECTELSSLKLPEGLMYIDKKAFYRNNLSEVTIPSTVILIDEDAFDVMGTGNNIKQASFMGSAASRGTSLKIIDAANFKSATTIYLDRDISSESSDGLFASAMMVTTGPDVSRLDAKPFGSSTIVSLTMQSIPEVSSGALSKVSGTTRLDLSDASYIHTGANGNLPLFFSQQYTRRMTNRWGTVVLPFSVMSDADVQYYTLDAIKYDESSNLYLSLVKMTEVPANTPCFFRRLTDGDEVTMISETAQMVADMEERVTTGTNAEDCILTGIYSTQTLDPADCSDKDVYYIANNMFWYAEKPFNISAFRAVLCRNRSLVPPSAISIRVQGDDMTGVGAADIDGLMGSEPVYDLQGRRVNNPEPGIYIVGGKKVIIQ